MKKISTLYKKNPENLGKVINEINPENEWVFSGEGVVFHHPDGRMYKVRKKDFGIKRK